jgi:bile acid-coenzyme A ligase
MALLSFSRIVSHLAEASPERPAVTCGKDTLTRRDLDLRTNRMARAYQQHGIRQDDLVTLMLPNSIAFFEVCIALWKVGATPQPVSYQLPQKELAAIVELTRPPLVVGVDADKLPDYPLLPAGFQPDPELPDAPLTDCVAKHWKACTSGGSTGRPKVIVDRMPSQFDVAATPSLVHLRENRVVLIPGPLYHNAPFGTGMEALLRGNHVVVMPKFDAEDTLRLIERYQVDWLYVVPTMMQRIWRLGDKTRHQYDLSSLRMVYHTAAPCPAWLKEQWIHWLGGEKIVELYGSTEGVGATRIMGDEWLQHKGSVGRPVDGCRMKVVDEQGRELPPGQTGEIYFRAASGPGSTYHYIGAESTRLEGGWESFGDIGYVDEAGYVYLADRKQDLIISGGANVYPAEVEAAIDAHPQVRSSIVFGIPDDDLGQKVHALVDAPKGLTEEELRTHLAEQIVRYKIPRSFEFVDTPLRDDAGKARRSVLAAQRHVQTHPESEERKKS